MPETPGPGSENGAARDDDGGERRERAPEHLRVLAHEREAARRRRDFGAADDLRARIEAAGWKVVDQGARSRLVPAHPADLVEGGVTRYGWSGSVPSRLDAPALPGVTLGLHLHAALAPTIAGRAELAATARRLVDGADDADLVLVLEASTEQALGDRGLDALAAADHIEVVRPAAPWSPGAAANAVLRRAGRRVVVVIDGTDWAAADGAAPGATMVEALRLALDDADVAIAGTHGERTGDLRRFEPTPPGSADVVVGGARAFRRGDAVARAPFDEGFATSVWLDRWSSLALRDTGEEAFDDEGDRDALDAHDRPPRQAVAIAVGASEAGHGPRAGGGLPEVATRRDFYRFVRRFGGRRDLLVEPDPGDWRAWRAARR